MKLGWDDINEKTQKFAVCTSCLNHKACDSKGLQLITRIYAGVMSPEHVNISHKNNGPECTGARPVWTIISDLCVYYSKGTRGKARSDYESFSEKTITAGQGRGP